MVDGYACISGQIRLNTGLIAGPSELGDRIQVRIG